MSSRLNLFTYNSNHNLSEKISELLGEVIKRIYNKDSVSSLSI